MMARWTRTVGIFTAFLAILAGVSATLSYCQLRAMRGQLDAMEADQRPWLTVSAKMASPMLVPEDGPIAVVVDITLRSTGYRPAVGVSAWPLFYAGEPGLDVVKAHKEKCLAGRNQFPGWQTLFPGEVSTLSYNSSIDVADAKLARPPPLPDTHYFTAFLVVCAYYRAANSEELHMTSSLYMLQKERK
jgi:hypothetical protein